MPISKSGNKYFTDGQLKLATDCSALEYARANHYDLVRQGARFIHRDHDSMIFLLDGRWFWNSRSLSGRALDLLIHYEGWSLVDAVLYLAGGDGHGSTRPAVSLTKQCSEPAEPTPFVLPARSKTQKHLFAYLCGYRKLDAEIIRDLVQGKRLYEGVHPYHAPDSDQQRECYNAVFLGLDNQETPQSAFQRGASSKSTFKCEVPGSKKLEHPFIIPGRPDATSVGFFEASIDAISHATLYKLNGVDYAVMERVAMGGIAAEVAAIYLSHHPEKKTIHLCLDADEWGIKGADRIAVALRLKGYGEDSGYQFILDRVPVGKDWNQYLMAIAP